MLDKFTPAACMPCLLVGMSNMRSRFGKLSAIFERRSHRVSSHYACLGTTGLILDEEFLSRANDSRQPAFSARGYIEVMMSCCVINSTSSGKTALRDDDYLETALGWLGSAPSADDRFDSVDGVRKGLREGIGPRRSVGTTRGIRHGCNGCARKP